MSGKKIDEMFAFVSVDSDGDEGIIGYPYGDQGGTLPMVGADMDRMTSLVPMAVHVAQLFGVEVKLIKFSVREELDMRRFLG